MKMLTGFRFRPSNDELINHYLLGKVRGEEITWDGIREFELYGEKIPWELFGDLDSEEEEKHYIFTRLKKSGKRVSRAAGCGTWHESSCNQVYDSEGQCVIGLNKQFCFKVKRESRVEKSHWIMHEFSLAGLFEQERCNNWVLCAVNKKGAGTKKGVKRCFQDVQIPSTIVPVEASIPSLENPKGGNTNILLLEDETHVGKRMRWDVQSDAFEVADQMPLSCLSQSESSQCERTLSPNSVDVGEDNTLTTDFETQMSCGATIDTADYGFDTAEYGFDESKFSLLQNFMDNGENNTQMTDLETHNMGCLPTDDNADSKFYGSYGYLPPSSTPEREHLPLDTWMNILL
ncbi:protein ATAF2-like [Corylus avellana]|uniref:protein ATAF2-like n=1 Tax=Corylus avellana TaxID=13451 RepID=UPI00286A5AD4|nr:protein ATAF2-like [Corylus avellana]